MTPKAAAHLVRAREGLGEARTVAALPLARVAAVSAYFAAFHAAEALIVARTGKGAKTQAGVQIEFARLTRDLPPADGALRRTLGRGRALRDRADYGIGPARAITDADAAAMIDDAPRLVDRVAALLAP